MCEIEVLDESKYLVLKSDDIIKFCNGTDMDNIGIITEKIMNSRKKENKSMNKYLVLNLDDEISIRYLYQKISKWNEKIRFGFNPISIKVKDIAVDIINAI